MGPRDTGKFIARDPHWSTFMTVVVTCAGNHLDKVVAPAVATADADAHYLISGKTNCDRQVSR